MNGIATISAAHPCSTGRISRAQPAASGVCTSSRKYNPPLSDERALVPLVSRVEPNPLVHPRGRALARQAFTRMRIGIIGTGGVAEMHARAYRNLGHTIRACTNVTQETG